MTMAGTLEFGEALFGSGALLHLEHVEANSLAQRATLSDRHDVSDLHVSATTATPS